MSDHTFEFHPDLINLLFADMHRPRPAANDGFHASYTCVMAQYGICVTAGNDNARHR